MKYTPEEIAELLKERPNQPHYIRALIKKAVNAAVLAEREECARVCESRYMGDNNREDMESKACAAAIRARGVQPND